MARCRLALLLLAGALLAVSAEELVWGRSVSTDKPHAQQAKAKKTAAAAAPPTEQPHQQHKAKKTAAAAPPASEQPQQQEDERWMVDTPRQLQTRNHMVTRTRRPVKAPGPIHHPKPVKTAVPVMYQGMLDLHNMYRTRHQAPDIEWDAVLASQAAAHAAACKWEHGAFGESMFLSSRMSDMEATTKNAVKMWYAEVVNYNFSDPGFKPAAAHFSQLVWKSSTLLGCAAKLCGPVNGTDYQHGTLVVCRYLPFGNILGHYADNVLPPLPPAEATFIHEGQVLTSPNCYTSPNNKYLLCMRRDARLMLMHRGNAGNYTLWTSSNARKPAGTTASIMQAQLQADGNLGVFEGAIPRWSSSLKSVGAAPRRLALDNDGNLVLYDAHNVALWETGTANMLQQWDGQLAV